MLVFGFASLTVHAMIAVSPSITLYGLDEPDLTSGLSVKIYSKSVQTVSQYCKNKTSDKAFIKQINNTFTKS